MIYDLSFKERYHLWSTKMKKKITLAWHLARYPEQTWPQELEFYLTNITAKPYEKLNVAKACLYRLQSPAQDLLQLLVHLRYFTETISSNKLIVPPKNSASHEVSLESFIYFKGKNKLDLNETFKTVKLQGLKLLEQYALISTSQDSKDNHNARYLARYLLVLKECLRELYTYDND